MKTHRLFILTVWSALLIALLIYPGFEVKGLVFGIIIGYCPFALWCQLGNGITLLFMFTLSAIEVTLCAWVMDKAKLTIKFWGMILFSIIAGATIIYTLTASGFEDWKKSPAVSAALESPEVHYEPSRRDYNEEVMIPMVLVGGMWGLYAAMAICAICSTTIILSRNRYLKSFVSATRAPNTSLKKLETEPAAVAYRRWRGSRKAPTLGNDEKMINKFSIIAILAASICFGCESGIAESDDSLVTSQVHKVMVSLARGHLQVSPTKGPKAVSGWMMTTEKGQKFGRWELNDQCEYIIPFGMDAVPELIKWLPNEQMEVRYVAARSLAKITGEDPFFPTFVTLQDHEKNGWLRDARSVWIRCYEKRNKKATKDGAQHTNAPYSSPTPQVQKR